MSADRDDGYTVAQMAEMLGLVASSLRSHRSGAIKACCRYKYKGGKLYVYKSDFIRYKDRVSPWIKPNRVV